MTVLPPMSKFPEVDQADARGKLAEIYDDIEITLRAPWVPFAIRVREASIIPGPPPPDPRPTLRAAGLPDQEISKISRMSRALDSLNYGNPKGLILITAWNEAWNESPAGSPANSLSVAESRQLPRGLPVGVEKLQLIDPGAASPDVQKLLRQAKDLLLHHAPMSDYRVLAAWRDAVRVAVEDILAPVALTAGYEETARQIRAIARKHVAGFPGVAGVGRRQMSDSLSGQAIAGLTGVLFMYNRLMSRGRRTAKRWAERRSKP